MPLQTVLPFFDEQLTKKQWMFPTHNRRVQLFYLICTALLTACAAVMTRFFGFLLFENAVRISLGAVFICTAGFLLGPVYGGLTGLLADVVGQLIRMQGAPHYGILLNSVLYGVIAGLIPLLLPFKRSTVALANLLCVVFLSALLQTRWIMDFSHRTFAEQFTIRLPGILINGLALILICQLLYPTLIYLRQRVRRYHQQQITQSPVG